MSMGGSTAGRSINCELGCSGTAQISLDDADVRDLADVPSGAISLDDFYGASAIPDVGTASLGEETTAGGFYMGTICAAGSCYYLIMAPNATGCAICQWKTTRTCSSVGDEKCDGYGNTYDHLDNSSHPAGNWTATRSIGGFSDWYLPAKCELFQLYTNCDCPPAGEGFASGNYWSSTEDNANVACLQKFNNGLISGFNKSDTYRVRAIRRVSF